MNHKELFGFGIGMTPELCLRVSAAVLMRVLFKHPEDSSLMLALERKATLQKDTTGQVVVVKTQPFGGAIRILDPERMQDLTGNFHFDSERSSLENDFRIFIRPADWPAVRAFCIEHIKQVDDPILESDASRELAEEFADALKIDLKPGQYKQKPIATLVEDHPAPTDNIHAQDADTVRIFRIIEVNILDPSLANSLVDNSNTVSDQDLCRQTMADARSGGQGRANAILALKLSSLDEAYRALSPTDRGAPFLFENNRLEETVPALLDGLIVPKYKRV